MSTPDGFDLKIVLYVSANPGCSIASAVEEVWHEASRRNRSARATAYSHVERLIELGYLRTEPRSGSGRGLKLFINPHERNLNET